MSKGVKYTKEFKQEAVNQVTIHGYSVNEVSKRLGICTKSPGVNTFMCIRVYPI